MTREGLIRELARYVVKGNKENFDEMTFEECPKTFDEFKRFGVSHSTVEEYMKDLLNEVVDAVEEEQLFVAEILYKK